VCCSGQRCEWGGDVRRLQIQLAALAIAASTAIGAAQERHDHAAPEKLGSVHFQTSCAAAAQPVFDRAVALLHSFDFGRAIDGFNAALKEDPSCVIAYWGIALDLLRACDRRGTSRPCGGGSRVDRRARNDPPAPVRQMTNVS
jgi:hypothetical protein